MVKIGVIFWSLSDVILVIVQSDNYSIGLSNGKSPEIAQGSLMDNQQKAVERDWTLAIMPLAYKCMVAEAQILYIVLPAG